MPELIYKITTDADLAAMKAAVADTEKMIESARAAGDSVNELSLKLEKLTDALAAYQEQKARDAGTYVPKIIDNATSTIYGPFQPPPEVSSQAAVSERIMAETASKLRELDAEAAKIKEEFYGVAASTAKVADETAKYRDRLFEMDQAAKQAAASQRALSKSEALTAQRTQVAAAMKAEQAVAQSELAAMAQAPLSEQTKQLAGLATAKTAATKAGHALTGQFRTLHMAMAPVLHSIPGMNLAMRFMHYGFSATVGAIGLVATALGAVIHQLKEARKHFDYSKEDLSGFKKSLEAESEALRNLERDHYAYHNSLVVMASAAAATSEIFKRLADARAGRRSSQETLEESRQALEIARANVMLAGDETALKEKLIEIEERYATAKRKRAMDDAKFALDALRREEASQAAKAVNARDEAESYRKTYEAKKVATEGRELDIAKIKEEAEAIPKKIEEEQAYRKSLKWKSLLGYDISRSEWQGSEERERGLELQKANAKANLKRLQQQQQRDLTELDLNKTLMEAAQSERAAAIKRGKELQTIIPDEERRLQQQTTTAAQQEQIQKQTNQWKLLASDTDPVKKQQRMSAIMAMDDQRLTTEPLYLARQTAPELRRHREDTLLNAGAGADALRAGRAASEDQKVAMREAAVLLDITKHNTPAIIAVLSALNDNQRNLAEALKKIERRVQTSR